ncbi:protein-disulfide reductase DsbD domain-containing protein [Aureimonas phyllosphaerae]|uniref:protein-disulfide reductase DsbD domain-containing protein n=2 Tax=Aureimonas phyllosphaerae TaxID=1166078 RepID=UPI000B82D4C9
MHARHRDQKMAFQGRRVVGRLAAHVFKVHEGKIDMSRRFCTCVRTEGLGRLAMMATALLLAPVPAVAAGGATPENVFRQEGVTLRLTALPAEADGHLRGALSIELDPGWKTYWIAPGPIGLAPRLDLSGSVDLKDVTVAFPVPGRFREGDAQSIGYSDSVDLPIEAQATGPMPHLHLRAFLGVCRELCVPVQAELSADPSRSLSHRALVARADASVPAATGPLTVRSARWSADATALLVDVIAPEQTGAAIDAFVSAGDGWAFGVPVPTHADPVSSLSIPVIARPSDGKRAGSADVLLTQGERAQLSRAVPIAPR